MKVQDLINVLKTLPPKAEFLVGSDEELNSLFIEWQIGELDKGKKYCIYGLSGKREAV